MTKQRSTAMIIKRTIIFFGLFVFAAVANASRGLPDFTDLVETYGPAVVNISTIQKKKISKREELRRHMPDMPEGGPFGEWFKRFFDEEGGNEGFNGHEPKAESLGSGFVISDDGYILTNNHVIEDADKIIVRLSDRRELDAELIGRDKRSDLALLKIKAGDLPVVKLGNSSKLKPGEWVLAIGSPFGFDYSVTAGIVSAKGRSLPRENYVPFIQTDVAINPGNSGGPLFNLDGEVVGINSQIYSRTGGYMGVSFAIPINIAMTVVEQLKESGEVKRGWLGVLIQDVTRDLAESFNMDKPHGALVARVLPDSPAEAAGFQVGDIVVKFNGQEIDHSSDLPPMVGITPINRKVPVDIIRNGKKQVLKVEIGELPKEDDVKIAARDPETTNADRIGLVVANIPDDLREKMEIDGKGGVIVKKVERGAAGEAGVRPGDVIEIVNNIEIKDADHFAEIVKELPAGKPVPVLVHQRRGGSSFLVIRIPDEE
jgi:serine protease Do